MRASRIRLRRKQDVKEKERIHKLVYRAILKGELSRPERCEACDAPAAHAHHPDYSEPLNVIWLCPLHHTEQHEVELAMAAW